ncbi:unnamed protein product, partial [Meganyctiphanes norvegica]
GCSNIEIWSSSSLVTALICPLIGPHDCILVGHSDGSLTLITLTAGGLTTDTLMHVGRQDVFVSCLAWEDQEKDMAIGFSDGVVRVCSPHSDGHSITLQAQQ